MSRTFTLSVLAAGILAAAPFAQAYEAGDFMLRVGPAHVAPDDSSSDLAFSGRGPLAGQNLALPGTGVAVDSNTQFGITATYMITSNIGVGILAATPFKHDINGADSLSGFGKFAETKHLPPTLTLQYYPMESASRFQPYAGLGVNYTTFFEEKTTGRLNAVIDSVAQANFGTDPGTVDGSKLDLDDSVGVALELGADYMLSENFGLNAAVWWIDLDTDATITALSGNTEVGEITTDVDIDPLVYMVGFTLKF
ncbi:outer membrane protein OmpW [Marinobacter panjinensis]|uniref:Outer membrane protein OmpW n=1 Tax=Marinobacter panjinensis TaxID=2576384 RepID=A0A4U6R727_9GAMM|nr:OmpW family outer membrane protein [Marinobacter panjinensis]MCR8914340.1 outer membrane beta-barrel protein [Marinobacter panjinensis]TKV68818.1 outer membrane protein OmpW [Marinobacter panjinensis]